MTEKRKKVKIVKLRNPELEGLIFNSHTIQESDTPELDHFRNFAGKPSIKINFNEFLGPAYRVERQRYYNTLSEKYFKIAGIEVVVRQKEFLVGDMMNYSVEVEQAPPEMPSIPRKYRDEIKAELERQRYRNICFIDTVDTLLEK